MNIETIRRYCLGLPHTTEQVQWGFDLVFKVGGKMYAVMPLEPVKYLMSFKCSLEDFAELTERPGIVPAPYMARAQWVALEHQHPLSPPELQRLLGQAHNLVFAKLTKKEQARFNSI